MKCIVFTGGGTGGHIFPGIAVAEVLRKQTEFKIVWLGNSRGMDKELVRACGIEFKGIPSGKLRRYVSIKNFLDIFKIAAGFFKALIILKKLKPAVVFSKGGFVSVPPCAAAALLKIPVITHECDFSPGLATRLNAKFAEKILLSYKETEAFFPPNIREKTLYTGNPVRLSFYNANKKQSEASIKVPDGLPILLVLGGSLGARQINGLIERNAAFLVQHFFVIHQAGKKNMDQAELIAEKLKALCPEYAQNYKAVPFINEMPEILAISSVAVMRAGANTLWELAAAGKPMILLPLEKSGSRGDQLENAAFFEKKGAAIVLRAESTAGDTGTTLAHQLKAVLTEFLEQPAKAEELGKKAHSLTVNKPAEIIAGILNETVRRSEWK